MDLKKMADRAKGLVEKRGGTESVKEDAQEVKGILSGGGSLSEKAKAAVKAVKTPGAEADAPTPAPDQEAAPTEGEPAGPGADEHDAKRRQRRERRRAQ